MGRHQPASRHQGTPPCAIRYCMAAPPPLYIRAHAAPAAIPTPRMATKAELLARLEEIVSHEDVEAAAEAVEVTKEAYEALLAAQQQSEHSEGEAQAAEGTEGEAPIAVESAALIDEEDKRFKQLLDSYNQRVNEIRRRKQKEEAENLAAKLAVMEELKQLIASEENIGSAFTRFKDLQERWKQIGTVPSQAYRELQRDFSHLLDEFFYHIRIYKELRDHDLRKNTGLKQALVSDVQALALMDASTPGAVRDMETRIRKYQDEWQHVGPTVKEEWEAIRDGFWNATRQVYDKINEYYRARRSEHEANLEAKKALVEKVQALTADLKAESTKEWKELTDQVLELQNAWKSIGFATKKDNERVWKEFRDQCNVFFTAKHEWFTALKDRYKAARDKKMALMNEAIALKDSTEWRRTADRLRCFSSNGGKRAAPGHAMRTSSGTSSARPATPSSRTGRRPSSSRIRSKP